MSFSSLEHLIRIIHEEKVKKINPANKVGSPNAEWESKSGNERRNTTIKIANSVVPPGEPKIKEDVEIVDENLMGISGKVNIMNPGKQKPLSKSTIPAMKNRIDPTKPPKGVSPKAVSDLVNKMNSEEADVNGVSKGTKQRREIEYVGRMDKNKKPTSKKSVLGRQSAYKINVIDEQRKSSILKLIREKSIHTDKEKAEKAEKGDNAPMINGKTITVVPKSGATPTVYRPNLVKVSTDGAVS